MTQMASRSSKASPSPPRSSGRKNYLSERSSSSGSWQKPPSTDGLNAEELEASKVGVDLRRARDLKQQLEEELGRAGLKMKLPARKCLDVLEAIELFEANLSDREVALDLLAIAQNESLVWPLDG